MKKSFTYNSLISGIGFGINAVTIFVLYRFLLQKLGPESIGTWSIIVSVTSMTGIGSSGFAGSIIKFVAKYLAKNNIARVVSIISTSFISIGVLILFTILILYPFMIYFLPELFVAESKNVIVRIILYVFGSFLVFNLAQVFQSTLDGYQRFDLRYLNSVLSKIAYLILSILLIPLYGLEGLAMAYLIHNILLFLLAYYQLNRLIKLKLSFLFNFKKTVFKEMLNYGLKFQAVSIAMVFIDPTTKIFLNHFGNLSFVGYYEMAYQLINQLKGALTSLLNIFVPVFASYKENQKDLLKSTLTKIIRISFLLAVFFFPLLIISLPIISELWIGDIHSDFIFNGSVLGIALWISFLAVPIFIYNLGVGSLNPNMITFILFALINLILGYVLGLFWKSQGVVVAFLFAALISNTWLIQSNYIGKKYITLFEKFDLYLIIFNFSCVILFLLNTYSNYYSPIFSSLALCVFLGMVSIIILSKHSIAQLIAQKFLTPKSNSK